MLRTKTWPSHWGLCLLQSVTLPHWSRVFQHVLLELLIHCCLRIIHPPGTRLAALSVGKSWLNRERLNTEHKSESDLGKLSRLMTRSACAHKYRNTSVEGWKSGLHTWSGELLPGDVAFHGIDRAVWCVCMCVWGWVWRQLCDQPAEDSSWSALKAC